MENNSAVIGLSLRRMQFKNVLHDFPLGVLFLVSWNIPTSLQN